MKKIRYLKSVLLVALLALGVHTHCASGAPFVCKELVFPRAPAGVLRAPRVGALDLKGRKLYLAAVLNIGRSESYGKDGTQLRTLTDAQLLAKEKRIEQRERRKEDSKLYRTLYSFCGFFFRKRRSCS